MVKRGGCVRRPSCASEHPRGSVPGLEVVRLCGSGAVDLYIVPHFWIFWKAVF